MAGLRRRRRRKKGIRRPCFLALAISISIPRERASERAKRLGLAEFQDRGASAKSESTRNESARGGSIRSVGRISGTGQTLDEGPAKIKASFDNNGTIPDVLDLPLILYFQYPLAFADGQVLFFFCAEIARVNSTRALLDRWIPAFRSLLLFPPLLVKFASIFFLFFFFF